MDIAIIAAISRHNGAIGLNGDLPWKLSADLKRFKRLTTGHTVVMGRKTYESIPAKFRPLPNRTNIVLTRDIGWDGHGVNSCTLDELFATPLVGTVFFIGGSSVFEEALSRADTAHITWVDYVGDFDVHWEPDLTDFDLADSEVVEADEKNSHASEYKFYRRKVQS